jgi:hypothetical protein
MPATLTAAKDGHGYLITGKGALTGPDILTLKAGVDADPTAPRDLAYWLVDLTGVTELQLSGQDFRDIVTIDRRLARRMPAAAVAVVAPKDVAFGLARMWEILADDIGWPTGVFRDVREAEAWIRGRTPVA